jgi:hypothetical protein
VRSGVDKDTNVCSTVGGTPRPEPGTNGPRLLSSSAPNPASDQGKHVGHEGATGGLHRPSTAESMSPSETADLERTVLALASNADEYWTTQQIADFVGRSKRQVYRILSHARKRRRASLSAAEAILRSHAQDPKSLLRSDQSALNGHTTGQSSVPRGLGDPRRKPRNADPL